MRALPKSRPARYPDAQPEVIGEPTVTIETVTPDQAADRVLQLLRRINANQDEQSRLWDAR